MATFARGARKSPRHRLQAAVPHQVLTTPPPQFAVVPKRLSYWDNERDGVCVSSEEAFAKAAWSVYCGLPEVFASEAEVRDFAARHGWLNGADLAEVLDAMVSEGMSIGGTVYKDGPHSGVDYSNETVLQSALTVGPVKIAIDANALPGGAGNEMGWHATGGGDFPNTDHCVALTGYGPASYLYGQLGLPVPAGLDPSKAGYLLFTWNTIGFVDHAWIMGTTTEAWVRNPTTPGQGPTPTPTPTPTPPPGPTPPPPEPPMTFTVHVDLPSIPVAVSGPLGRPLHGSTAPTTVIGTGTLGEVQGLGAEAQAGLRTFLQLLVKYGLPIAVALLPLVLSKGFGVLANPAVIAWILAALAAEKANQPLPPLPTV